MVIVSVVVAIIIIVIMVIVSVVVAIIIVVIIIVVVVVVVAELPHKDLAQQPGQLLSVGVFDVRVPGIRVPAEAKEEGIGGGEDNQEGNEELHLDILMS